MLCRAVAAEPHLGSPLCSELNLPPVATALFIVQLGGETSRPSRSGRGSSSSRAHPPVPKVSRPLLSMLRTRHRCFLLRQLQCTSKATTSMTAFAQARRSKLSHSEARAKRDFRFSFAADVRLLVPSGLPAGRVVPAKVVQSSVR